uniref:Protein kinase domain-containing protein n=1 Tax=Amphora coffeiformis TaxID=265554 RepID=A0A7S3L1A0_9STRA
MEDENTNALLLSSSANDGTKRGSIPKFARKEIDLGSLIGSGGFSIVHQVDAIIDLDEIYDTDDDAKAARLALQTDAAERRTLHGHPPYVFKTLRSDLDEEEHTKGVIDLAIEAEFLSEISHAHILPLCAMAHGDMHGSRFFVLLPRLAVTLDRKFNYWRKVVGDNAGFYLAGWGYCCAKTAVLTELWKERMGVMRQVASAVQYLHAHGIMYRDLKPDNIGFDDHDAVKLFDFGLAKRWRTAELASDGHNYHLTGQTGSLRYMAPEIAMEMPYNESCDVFSWGILFWQVCSLQTPFSKYNARTHAERVVMGGERPKLERSWPRPWRELMEESWRAVAGLRPPMQEVLERVTAFERALGGGDNDDDDYDNMEDVESGAGGGVSSDTSKIKAKKKKKATADSDLDVGGRAMHNNHINHNGHQTTAAHGSDLV